MSHNLNSENTQRVALIMKGGGAKGLAYLGAIQVLVDHFEFNWFVGTSAGAITAVLLAAGYSVDRLIPLVRSKNFKDFMDLRLRSLLSNFIIGRGIYKGDELERWVEEILYNELHIGAEDNPIRLEQLHIKNKNRLTVYASTKYDNAKDYDSHNEETKGKRAKRVVRFSASIPFFFTLVYNDDGAVFDGGLSHNYPINVFLEKYNEDKTLKFLGLYLGRKPGSPKTTNYSVVSDLLDRWLSGHDKTGLRKYEKQTVVIDPFPVTTLRFNLTEDEKDFLLATGRASALHYLRYQAQVASPPSEKEVTDATEFAEKLRAELIPIFNRRKWKRRLIALFLALLLVWIIYIIIPHLIPSRTVYDYWTREKTEEGKSPRHFHHKYPTLAECQQAQQNEPVQRFIIDGFRCDDLKPTREQLQKSCDNGDYKSCEIGKILDSESGTNTPVNQSRNSSDNGNQSIAQSSPSGNEAVKSNSPPPKKSEPNQKQISKTNADVQVVEKLDKPRWYWWYIHPDKILINENDATKEECLKSTAAWSYQPIMFRCRQLSDALLKEAEAACSAKQDYACEWRDQIKNLLNPPPLP